MRRSQRLPLAAVLFYSALAISAITTFWTGPARAGIIDDALALPGMEAVKNSGVEVDLESIDDVTGANGRKYRVIGQTDGEEITLNSKVFNNNTDPGAAAQTILHEYIHIREKHKGNCKENELLPRRREAAFWREYKRTHPGASSTACDANERLVYANGAYRSEADTLKDIHDNLGYPDDPDGKEESNAIYSVESAGREKYLSLNSGSTELIFGAEGPDTEPIVIDAIEGNAVVMLEDESGQTARFKVTHYHTVAPPVDLPPSPLFPEGATTGENILALDPDQDSYGYVDLDTGDFTVYLKGIITNALFGPQLPIRTTSHIRGKWDKEATVTLSTLSFDFFPPDPRPLACVPCICDSDADGEVELSDIIFQLQMISGVR
jgi:hypothetical protein